MFKKFLLVSWLSMLLVACAWPGGATDVISTPTPIPPTATTAPATAVPTVVPDKATIEGLEVQLSKSFPLQATAVLQGEFPDACTIVDSVDQTRVDNTI